VPTPVRAFLIEKGKAAMQLPTYAPAVAHRNDGAKFHFTDDVTGLQPQKCNVWEWVGCGAAVAGCFGLTGPALIACVAAVAPGCVKCVT
jgi:hypothetical protein